MENAAKDTIRASRVSGTEVYADTGEHLGHVEDLVIGKRDGRVRHAIMSFGGFLGIGADFHPIPWSMLHYDTERRAYVVPVTREQLLGAPRFSSADEPDWEDDAFHRNVTTYYGVPPII